MRLLYSCYHFLLIFDNCTGWGIFFSQVNPSIFRFAGLVLYFLLKRLSSFWIRSELGRTVWGIVGGEVGGMPIVAPPEGKFIVTTTRSHSSSTVNDAIAAVAPTEVLRVGGAGHKVRENSYLKIDEFFIERYILYSHFLKWPLLVIRWDGNILRIGYVSLVYSLRHSRLSPNICLVSWRWWIIRTIMKDFTHKNLYICLTYTVFTGDVADGGEGTCVFVCQSRLQKVGHMCSPGYTGGCWWDPYWHAGCSHPLPCHSPSQVHSTQHFFILIMSNSFTDCFFSCGQKLNK